MHKLEVMWCSLYYLGFSLRKPAVDVIFDVINYASFKILHNIMKDFRMKVSANFNLLKNVGREKHRMKAFIRFEQRRYLFAKIDPDFDVLTLIIKHFKKIATKMDYL
jgi:probable DNA metabolism protein